jgi:hypothetical protein
MGAPEKLLARPGDARAVAALAAASLSKGKVQLASANPGSDANPFGKGHVQLQTSEGVVLAEIGAIAKYLGAAGAFGSDDGQHSILGQLLWSSMHRTLLLRMSLPKPQNLPHPEVARTVCVDWLTTVYRPKASR